MGFLILYGTFTGTITLTASDISSKDLGESHTYRYIKGVNTVYNKGVTDACGVGTGTYYMSSNNADTVSYGEPIRMNGLHITLTNTSDVQIGYNMTSDVYALFLCGDSGSYNQVAVYLINGSTKTIYTLPLSTTSPSYIPSLYYNGNNVYIKAASSYNSNVTEFYYRYIRFYG